MAYTGLQYAVVAKIATETAGSAITYSTGKVLGKLISANLTWTRNDNPLYADDSIAENDNGVTGGTIEINTDDITEEGRVYVLGDTEVTVGTGTTTTEYETTDKSAPYVGVGFLRVRRKNGVTSYIAEWVHKAQFAMENEEAQTKGETIEWQTPTITGTIFGVHNDLTTATSFRRIATFETETAAKTWLNTKAGIS